MNIYIPKAILIVLFLLSFIPVKAQQVTVNFSGELSGDIGDEVTLSVGVSDLTGYDISNFDIRFSFDSDLIFFEAEQIKSGDLITTLTANVTDDDRILVSYANSSPITGEGVLFEVTGILIESGTNETGVIVTELFLGDSSLDVSPDIPFEIPIYSGDQDPELLPPSLISPQNGSSDLSDEVTFSWTEETDVEMYQLMLSEDSFFTDIVIDSTDIQSTTLQLETDLKEDSEYYWKVRSIAGSFESEWSNVFSFRTKMATSSESGDTIPNGFNLGENYPNPFNPGTSLTYQLPEVSEIQVDLYNMYGQKLAILENGKKPSGVNYLNIDMSGYSSGAYIIRLVAVSGGERFSANEKITLVK